MAPLFIQLLLVTVDVVSVRQFLLLISLHYREILACSHPVGIEPLILVVPIPFVSVLRHLVPEIRVVLPSGIVLLLRDVIVCGVHPRLRFFFEEVFLLKLLEMLFDLWLQHVLAVLVAHAVLSLFDLLYVSTLVVVAPTDMAWRERFGLFLFLMLKIKNFFLVSHQLSINFGQLLTLDFSLPSAVLLIEKGGVPISLQKFVVIVSLLAILQCAEVLILGHLLFGHYSDLVLLLKVSA